MDRLAAEALTKALGEEVTSVEVEPVGTGQVASCFRLSLTYAADNDLPATMVAKCPADDPQSRSVGIALGHYRAEASFYRDLAPGLDIRTPIAYHVSLDETTHDFLLLLEDLAPAEQGDQIAGCDLDTAVLALSELPKLHVPHWGDPSLEGVEWLDRSTPESADMTAMLLAGLIPGFHERFDERLDPEVVALIDRIVEPFLAFGRDADLPRTVQHGDYRLDNMLFGTRNGGPPVAVVDWQTVVLGPAMADVSYFIGAGLVPEERRAHEVDLVRMYHRAVTDAGVDLGWDDCWLQYRQFAPAGLIVAVGASMLVGQTDRGDDMFVAMAERHGRHVLDLDSESVLSA